MPRRAKALALPAEVRERLDGLLIERGFSGYAELADWLSAQGHPVSRSAVHRYGTDLERRIESVRLSTEMANALVSASPDDAGAMADASLRLVQDRMFALLMASEAGDLKEIAAAARAIAETARAGTSIRAERRKVMAEAAAAVRREGRARGLSEEVLAAIDARLMPETA